MNSFALCEGASRLRIAQLKDGDTLRSNSQSTRVDDILQVLNLLVFGCAWGSGVFLREGEDELAHGPLCPGTGVGSGVFVQGHLRDVI